MEINYQGVDITEKIIVKKCIVNDMSEGESDNAEIVMGNAANWYRWEPAYGDEIVISEGAKTFGRMFVTAVEPENGDYKMLCTAMRAGAMQRKNAVYRNLTISQIAGILASETDSGHKMYGIVDNKYRCITRYDETAPALLERLARYEGAAFKVYNGNYLLISIGEAEKLEAVQTMELSPSVDRYMHIKYDSENYQKVTLIMPDGKTAVAEDASTASRKTITMESPTDDITTAQRWARGILMMHNRKAESIIISTELNMGLTACARIDISSAYDISGRWIISKVRHDLINRTSKLEMFRVVSA